MKPKVIDRVNVIEDDRGYLNTKTYSNTDLDTLTQNGNYYVYSPINSPTGVNGYVEVVCLTSDYCYQTFTVVSTGEKYIRHKNDGIWTDWQELATTLNSLVPKGYYQSKNMDDLKEQGSYICYQCTNTPSIEWGTVSVILSGSGAIIQDWVSSNGVARWYRHFNGVNWGTWQEISRNNIDIIAGQTDILSYAKTFKQHYTKTVRCNSAVNNPLGSSAYNDFYYTIYGTDHINGYWNIIASDILTGTIYTNVCTANVWGDWQQVATTTKTPFICTPYPGYTIHQQDCYKINNHVYINVWVKPDSYGFTPNSQRACFSSPYFNVATSSVGIVTYWANVNGGMYLSSNAGTMHLDGVAWLNLGASADQYINFKCDFEL